jgi:enamine deaminase RidA (YjgF/YER057c/UK114 family)
LLSLKGIECVHSFQVLFEFTYLSSLSSFPMKNLFLAGLLLTSALSVWAQSPEQRLEALGITLTTPPAPMANYVRTVRVGNLVYTSGHGPSTPDIPLIKGRLGDDMTVEQGYEAARVTGIALLSSLKAEIGDLSQVKRIVKVLGMVHATPDFTDHPKVMNGFSDLMVEVFGPAGKHARSAVGMGSLPSGMAIEIEIIVELHDPAKNTKKK